MTITEAKRVLSGYRHESRRIEEMRARIAQVRETTTRATFSAEAVRIGGSGNRSRVECCAVQLIDLEEQLDRMIDESIRERCAIQSTIRGLEDARERRLLELRYIDGRSWHTVNWRLEVSETTSRRVHAEALAHFAAQYKRQG